VIEKVALGALPPQRKVMEVLVVLSIGLAGSRFPKLRLEVFELNLHSLLERTVAVTATIWVSAALTIEAIPRIKRIKATGNILTFNYLFE
jgi:hypothetical protein